MVEGTQAKIERWQRHVDEHRAELEAMHSPEELCRRLGDGVRSGGVVSRHFDDLDAVLEFDALDDFGQLIFAL